MWYTFKAVIIEKFITLNTLINNNKGIKFPDQKARKRTKQSKLKESTRKENVKIKKISSMWGTWVAQLIEWSALGFGSGHDLTVHEFQSHFGLCTDSTEPAWDFVSLSLPLSGSLSLSLSLKINK